MAYSNNELLSLLAKNKALSIHAEEHEKSIRHAAKKEYDRIGDRLSKLSPGQVALSPSLAYDYQRLVDERGKLTRLL